MANLPDPLTFGTVTGWFASAVGDSADLDLQPDMVFLTGTVQFTPSVPVVKAILSTPPITLVRQVVSCTLVGGQLVGPDGAPGVRLLASDSPGVTPTGVTWTAVFQLDNVAAQPATIVFFLESGTTVDLSTLIPVTDSPATINVSTEQTRIGAELAAAAAQLAADQAAQSAIDAAASAAESGASAYEIAVLNGFVGSETEWLASLVGPAGDDSPVTVIMLDAAEAVPEGTAIDTVIIRRSA